MPILLKLYSCLGVHIVWVIFCHFFTSFMAKVNGLNVFCVGNSSYRFMPISSKLYRCLGHDLKICISLRYNPVTIFTS